MNNIPLPYDNTSLEPVISERTIAFHHGKHLQTYVDNLNKLLPGSGMEELPLEEIVKKSTGAIFNNAGQILNHNLYFTQFAPQPSLPAPTGTLAKQLANQWGTLDAFKAEFEAKGVGLFGSGWVWLQANEKASSPSPSTPTRTTRLLTSCPARPGISNPSSPSTFGNTPTTWTTRTAALRIWPPCGRL